MSEIGNNNLEAHNIDQDSITVDKTGIDQQLNQFEQLLKFEFADSNLLRRALTHRSFVNEADDQIRDNERLEFLGDAILDFIAADMLFRRFPDMSEGELTELRSALVRTDSLAQLAIDVQLGDFLLIGRGEEKSGGRLRQNNLCRGFEALIGAMFMDRGIVAVEQFVVPRLDALLSYVLEHDLHKDARTVLQERSQAELHFTPVYRIIQAAGPDHDKEYHVEVVVGDVVVATGTGNSKRGAAQSAARSALVRLETEGWPEEAERMTATLKAQLDVLDNSPDDLDTTASDDINGQILAIPDLASQLDITDAKAMAAILATFNPPRRKSHPRSRTPKQARISAANQDANQADESDDETKPKRRRRNRRRRKNKQSQDN